MGRSAHGGCSRRYPTSRARQRRPLRAELPSWPNPCASAPAAPPGHPARGAVLHSWARIGASLDGRDAGEHTAELAKRRPYVDAVPVKPELADGALVGTAALLDDRQRLP